MNRRGFLLGGLGAILAASVAPALITSRGVRGMTRAASGLLLPGDIVTFGGDPLKYVVTFPNMVVKSIKIDYLSDRMLYTVAFKQRGHVGAYAGGAIQAEGGCPFELGKCYTIEELFHEETD